MKSAVFNYQKNETTIDFEGHIALIFFTQGCNFRCRYCHNPELIGTQSENMSYAQLGAVLSKARQNWVDGICITGGEPTLQKELAETFRFIKGYGMETKLDTQGSFPDALEAALPFCDYVAMDYKMPLQQYPDLVGVSQYQEQVQASVALLKKSVVDYEFRTTIIPGIHDEKNIRSICQELQGAKRFVLQTFIPRDNLPDERLRVVEKTSLETMEKFEVICKDFFEEVIRK